MKGDVLQLYPLPTRKVPLKGLYLTHEIRQIQGDLDRPFLFANFISSLDGRISNQSLTGKEKIPQKIANPRDWRLFQELAVQADLLITSGRYLREYAPGEVQDVLRIYDDPDLVDLLDWRIERGLQPYPDLAVISRSLDFTVPDALVREDRKVLVFTPRSVDASRAERIKDQVDEVIAVGDDSVDGLEFRKALTALKYRVVCSAAGPQIHHLLLAAGVLDRLYITLASKILGGKRFSSIVEGSLLEPEVPCHLGSLYYDPLAFDGSGQLFISYNVTPCPY